MKRLLTVLTFIPLVFCASAQIVPESRFAEVRKEINRPFYSESLSALMKKADSLLEVRPLAVTDKEKVAPSGDRHDYMSQARYFWPDPSKTDGLPYISRDGISNPEIYKLDRYPLGDTADRINTLSMAYYFSGDEKYARKAVELIKVWFLDGKTRMNPNLEYAQSIPGVDNGKGRCYGVIDAYSFVPMLDGVRLLEKSKSFKASDRKALKKWFAQMADWMMTSKQGQEERRQANNHSTACDAQVMAFALYGGNRDLAQKIASTVASDRIFKQIEPDGRQPHELRRTLAYGYSQYNLTHLLDIMEMAANAGLDMGTTVSADGRSVSKGLDFLARYIGKDAPAWEYEQISGFEGKKQECLKDLYRAWLLNPSRNDYMQKYFDNRVLDYSDIFNLLYVRPRPVDDAMVSLAPQLDYAIACIDKESRKEANAAKRRFAPWTLNKDGSLHLVDSYHWCSGFFPGTLWQMYEYTNDNAWREKAVSKTWPVEDAKWHKGTHDLGFMINDSFGKAYSLTGEQSYKDVVVRAAKTLITRYNPVVKSIRSWDHNAERWHFPVIIDNMMNLEMLFQATRITGDSIYHNVAVNHANTTLANHFRPDASSYHVVDYDPQTGAVRMKCTAQGYSDDSFWSRGQAWGLYGYAQCYQYTGDEKYLEMSERIADFIMSRPNMPSDKIPYWDMKDPRIADLQPGQENAECPRDASAAAVTASGLYMLSDMTKSGKAALYRSYADDILKSLTENYRVPAKTKYGFLLDHSTGHHPAGAEIDVPLNYADYYYVEALLRQARHQGIPETDLLTIN